MSRTSKQINTSFSGADLEKLEEINKRYEFINSDQEIIRICIRFVHKYFDFVEQLKTVGITPDLTNEELRERLSTILQKWEKSF